MEEHPPEEAPAPRPIATLQRPKTMLALGVLFLLATLSPCLLGRQTPDALLDSGEFKCTEEHVSSVRRSWKQVAGVEQGC